MGRRGATPFEDKIGIDKFKELLKRLTIPDIAKLYCNHEIDEDKKASCRACIRSIYRAKKRVETKARTEKRYDPIDTFELIPEVQQFIEYEKAKGKKGVNAEVNALKTMWTWIKDVPELTQLQRPALWDERHFMAIIKKLKEMQISQYGHKETLRRFFESIGNLNLMKHILIRASRKDLRSPKGAKRQKTDFAPSMLPKIWECLNNEERLAIDLHVTVKSREGSKGGSLVNAQWQNINWENNFYGFPTPTIDIYEPKTKGGTWWRHSPIDLWFNDLSKRLYEKWERLGKPKEGKILEFTYNQYLELWRKISEHVGRKLEPHDCRRSAGGWLRDLGLSELALGQYNPVTGEAIGYTGVGWENSEIYFQRYGKMNPKAIYNKQIRLDTTIFNGLIHKILENK